MALNPFFLQGSPGEQRLIQNLINEQLQIYGVEVTYIPRKFVNKQSIIEEVQSSKFDDNFLIEAYVNTYEGYSGAGDIMTKFGVSLRDEITLTISKERFEDFIAPFLNDDEYELATRPREGDLIFFPLGTRLFEVKFVEHEQPFYQLGKNYVYQLQCELFEYEDEVIDTGVDEIDQEIEDEGFITTLNLVGTGVTATATAAISVNSGYVNSISLLNDGSGYTGTPTVSISTSRASGGTNASAVAITTERAGVFSIKEIILTNPGSGYTVAPSIRILGGNGSGAIATCNLITSGQGVISFNLTQEGRGYTTNPAVTVAGPTGVGTTALVSSISKSPINNFDLYPMVTSIFDGPIASSENPSGGIRSEQAYYKVTLDLESSTPSIDNKMLGYVNMAIESKSYFERFIDFSSATLIRELNF